MFGFNFTESQKGYLSLFMNVILLFNSLGWFTNWFSGIVLIYAIFLIVYGVLKTHVVKLLWDYIAKMRKPQSPAK